MAGLFKRLFGRREERAGTVGAPDIEAMLDWSPGPPAPPPPVFRVAPRPPPPPPPPPPPEGSGFDESTRVLWGVPPPPPPSASPEVSRPRPRVRLMLADGSIVHPPAESAWQDRFAYLAENLLPPGGGRRPHRIPKVRIVLADGRVIEGAEDKKLQERIQYLAQNLLPRPRRA
jgi:hypothetical protein